MASPRKESPPGHPFSPAELSSKIFVIKAIFITHIFVTSPRGYFKFEMGLPFDGQARGPIPEALVREAIEYEHFVEMPFENAMSYEDIVSWWSNDWHTVSSYFYALMSFVEDEARFDTKVNPADVTAIKTAILKNDWKRSGPLHNDPEIRRLFDKIGFMRP